MSDLLIIKKWLKTYKGYNILKKFRVDFTDHIPCQGALFPSGVVEVSRTTDILGNTLVRNQLNFAIYYVFPFTPGDDVGATINADWVMDFQKWVQEQSVMRLAPTFGNSDQYNEKISAQNGSLYANEDDGTAIYMVQLAVTFTNHFEIGE